MGNSQSGSLYTNLRTLIIILIALFCAYLIGLSLLRRRGHAAAQAELDSFNDNRLARGASRQIGESRQGGIVTEHVMNSHTVAIQSERTIALSDPLTHGPEKPLSLGIEE